MDIYKICFLPFLLFISLSATAQLSDIDLLKNKISQEKPGDTAVVTVLCNIATEYRSVNADSMMHYAGKAWRLAEKLGFEDGKTEAMKLNGIAAGMQGETSKAFSLLQKAQDRAVQRKDRLMEANVCNEIAIVYYHMANHGTALLYFNKAYTVFKQLSDKKGMGKTLGNMANIYLENHKYTEALGTYQRSLAIGREIKDSAGMAIVMANIADLYSMLGKYKEFNAYNKQSYVLNKKLDNKLGILQNVLNAGQYYSGEDIIDSAIVSFSEGMALSKEVGEKYYELCFSENLADMYLRKKEYGIAGKLYSASLAEALEFQDTNLQVAAQTGLAQIMMLTGKRKEGIAMAKEALVIARNNNFNLSVFNLSQYISEALQNEGNYKEALEFYKVRSSFGDSIHYEKEQKQLLQLRFDEETANQETRIQTLKKEASLQEERLRAKNMMLVAFGIASLLLLAGIINIYKNRQRLKKSSQLITEQNNVLEIQSTRLEENNHFKDKIISILSHDLRSPIASLDMAMSLMDSYGLDADEAQMLRKGIHKQIGSLYITLDNLVAWSKTKLGESQAQQVSFSLQSVVVDNIQLLGSYAENKQIGIVNNVPARITLTCVRNELDTVLRNLLTNAIKFTPAGGTITIGAVEEDRDVKILVADTGMGMEKEQVAALFRDDNKKRRQGTNGENGTGIGLLLCREFIDKNGGNVVVISEPGKGSTFIVTLPLEGNQSSLKSRNQQAGTVAV